MKVAEIVMKLKLLTSIFIALLAIIPATAQNRNVLAKAESISGDTFTTQARTPKGAAVYAVSRPSNAVLNAIDKGLTDLFAVARKNGYSRKLNYSDYSIYIAKPDRLKNAAGQYSPDIAVGANQYAGSVYDQGGYIYAAGMVIYNNPCAFLIAEYSKNFERITEVVRYEGEHLVLYHNDRQRYNATADHSKGGGHPILQ
jgi:hypothetical protein